MPAISQLNGAVALTAPASADVLPITDVSDTTEHANGTTKKITWANLFQSPPITTPTISGIYTADGANVTTANAMAALAIDVTKGLNTKSVAADSTFTFSGAPATANTWFGMLVTNTDTLPHILTIPSSFDLGAQTTRTTTPIAASGRLYLVWNYNGTTYNVFGASGFLNKYDATVAPAASDDVSQGYGPGSLWVDTVSNLSYINESNGAAAAVWNRMGDGLPQNSQSAAYTLVLADTGKHILHPTADVTARTFTIPANASVAYIVGTKLCFINQNGAGIVTIAITTDTMRLAGAGTTGSRTLAANGIAVAIKLTATEWIIDGVGLT